MGRGFSESAAPAAGLPYRVVEGPRGLAAFDVGGSVVTPQEVAAHVLRALKANAEHALGVPVRRPVVAETTALGAAYLAGLAVGYWDGLDDVRRNWALDREFSPLMGAEARARGYDGWKRAVQRSLGWAQG
jgi:glycerol kinase